MHFFVVVLNRNPKLNCLVSNSLCILILIWYVIFLKSEKMHFWWYYKRKEKPKSYNWKYILSTNISTFITARVEKSDVYKYFRLAFTLLLLVGSPCKYSIEKHVIFRIRDFCKFIPWFYLSYFYFELCTYVFAYMIQHDCI